MVSRAGTTGAREAFRRICRRRCGGARAAGRLPIAVGFGIASPQGAREAAALADGVIVGSALVRAAEEAGDSRESRVEALARTLSAACRRSGREAKARGEPRR